MSNPERFLCLWGSFLGLGFLVLVGSGQQEKTSVQPQEAKSLIRMDLLRGLRGEQHQVLRNIFSPGSGVPAASASRASLPSMERGSEEGGDFRPEEEAKIEAPSPVFRVNLRYIGRISSAHRQIGLIILDGQALAVAEGEVVSEGIRVGKITAEEIEVILPDSSSRKFPLEGE